jgi:hypothetical protein
LDIGYNSTVVPAASSALGCSFFFIFDCRPYQNIVLHSPSLVVVTQVSNHHGTYIIKELRSINIIDRLTSLT